MAKTELTIILPGLANVVQQQINANILPKSLKTIISKARFTANDSNLTRLLFNLFSENPIDTADLPYTQLLNTKTPILCATPCYLHADRDRLLLFANQHALTRQESDELIDELQQLFEEFNATLIRHKSGEFLLQLTTLPKVQFSALADVDGKAVTHYLPEGEDKGNWIRLWNEIQMKLYESPFNQKREASGKIPINSLWFWGMGKFNAKRDYWQSVQGEHHIVKQLVEATSNALATGRHLQLLDELDLEADWQQQLEQWDQCILKPALQQCRKAKIKQLTLIIPEYGKYVLTPLSSWKFW